MMKIEEAFEIVLPDIKMIVTSHLIGGSEIYRIEFSDGRPPLNVTEANGYRPFWTSVPQGRQIEAEFFGKKIAEHLKNK
ncbi:MULTISPECIES: hypothetical protein [Pedobacter]|uniref:Uncharacterized protein n=2 Tax=Pedobacter TaxID=84567 RepID=A0A369PQP7_9SPHI|nr:MULTISPECIES: hypothetical protein [Pedobacter]MCZ4224712.1 hypothetical protein [Pedobacter sp. SJ11]RDC54612.1 hypothetical protein DU508_20535 [Pedobacter chinensis]